MILGIVNAKNKLQIKVIQKKAISVISNSKYNGHTAPHFKNLILLSYDKKTLQGKLQVMHNFQ